MTKPVKPAKKQYRPPRLVRFGDLRTLTGGNINRKQEPGAQAPKTKFGGPG